MYEIVYQIKSIWNSYFGANCNVGRGAQMNKASDNTLLVFLLLPFEAATVDSECMYGVSHRSITGFPMISRWVSVSLYPALASCQEFLQSSPFEKMGWVAGSIFVFCSGGGLVMVGSLSLLRRGWNVSGRSLYWDRNADGAWSLLRVSQPPLTRKFDDQDPDERGWFTKIQYRRLLNWCFFYTVRSQIFYT